MRISWKHFCLAGFVAFPLLFAGCGGINASRTVSPLDFLLPGILRADPAPAPLMPGAPATNSVPV